MKLCTYTTVKDEEDIIESFVRYHLNIVDRMVISNNCSNDNTLLILKKLQEEGLSIDILEDNNQYFDQNKKRKELLDYTMNKYNPDFVFPLDADEFISSYSGENPRDIISKLNKDTLYQYKMVNYVIDKDDNKEELFIPKRLLNKRIEESDKGYTYKCFFSNEVYNDKFVIVMGSHLAYYNDDSELKNEINDDLFLAHYPVRSKEQLMNKVIIGRLNNSSLHSRKEGLGFHQYEILDEIIDKGTISDETLYDMSKYYGINKDEVDVLRIEKDPIKLSFCKDIEIKYYNKYNSNLLSNTIKMSEAIIDIMREKNKKSEEINEEYNKVINSKRWKFINKFLNFFKIKK